MKAILIIALLGIGITSYGGSLDVQDSIKIDRKKIDKAIREIKKGSLLKSYRLREISFLYPSSISSDKIIPIEVVWKGNVILVIDLDARTYKIDQIIDFR